MPTEPASATHYVAPIKDETVSVDALHISDKASNLWLDAWRDLRRRPLFWVSLVVFLTIVLMAVWPTLFTHTDPGLGEPDPQ